MSALWNELSYGYRIMEAPDAEELVTCLRGEPGCYVTCSHQVQIGGHLYNRLHSAPGDRITIVCSDGRPTYSKAMLRRRFHFFDDYFSVYPDEMEVRLSCTVSQMTCVIERGPLMDCYELLCHLNPRSNLYPFYCEMDGVPLSIVLSLAAKLTEDEKNSIVSFVLRRGESKFVPDITMPYLLTAFPTVRAEVDLLKNLLLPRYPSYAFCIIAHSTREVYLKQLAEPLLTWDFSVDQDDFLFSDKLVVILIEKVLSVCLPGSTKTIAQLATELGREVPSTLPYGVVLV